MKAVKTILAPIDLSDHSLPVLRFAVELAADLHADLVILNVINQRDIDAIEMVEKHHGGPLVKDYVKAAMSERLELISRLVAQSSGGVFSGARRLIRTGVPFREILKTVDEEQAGMVVMGTQGRGSIAGTLFGSTAEKVFRRCPVPLVSVRTTALLGAEP
jgi:nucleotide-binding universal stress UspA family protein